MDQVAPSVAHDMPQDAPRRGGRWKPGESGNPTGSRVSKRVVELFEGMAYDFGGVDALSAVDGALLQQAARLMARSERTQTAEDAVRLANAAARMLASLHRARRRAATPEPPTFAEYLARGAAPKPVGALVGDPARVNAPGKRRRPPRKRPDPDVEPTA